MMATVTVRRDSDRDRVFTDRASGFLPTYDVVRQTYDIV